MWSSRYLDEPLFLKASECIDIHAAGALAQFAVLKFQDGKPSASQTVGGDTEIFDLDRGEFIPIKEAGVKDLYSSLYKHASCSGEGLSEEELDQVGPYIMSAGDFNEHCRQACKRHRGEHFVILSMVCCPDNIERLTADIRGDKRAQRAVKLMKRQQERDGLLLTSFTRVKCVGSRIDGEVALLQAEDGSGDFLLLTSSDALLAQEGKIYKLKGVNFAAGHDAFQAGRSIDEIAAAAGFKESRSPEEDQLPVTTSPVVVLQSGKAPVELLHRLSDETRQKVIESKDINPTQIHAANRLTGFQGAAFKYAECVSLGIMERPGRVVSYRIKTLLLECKHDD